MTLVRIIRICMKHIRSVVQDYLFADIDFSNFPSFIFKVNHVFMEEKDNPVGRVVINGEKLDGIDIDGSLNRVFIDYKCWNLTVVVDGGDLTRNINKKKSDVLQACRCPLCHICNR